MKIELVNLQRQYQRLKTPISAAIAEVLEKASFIGGQKIREFEESFAQYCGASYAVGVANGTAALELSLRALGIGCGHEVIVPSMTFIATSEAVRLVGAIPVFVDVYSQTGLIDTKAVAKAITAKTKAVIPVHLYGRSANLTELAKLAENNGFFIIGDAAQAHGAIHQGKPIAEMATLTCFSFYPGKNLGAYGDGGAIVTNDAELAKKVRMMANHGRSDKYFHQILGTNARLDTLQASILSVKLAYLEEWNNIRSDLAKRYNSLLLDIDGIELPVNVPDKDRQVWHLYVIRVKDGKRDDLLSYLEKLGIGAGIHYPVPLHLQPCNADLGVAKLPICEQMAKEIISLPLCPELTYEEQDKVVKVVRNYFANSLSDKVGR